ILGEANDRRSLSCKESENLIVCTFVSGRGGGGGGVKRYGRNVEWEWGEKMTKLRGVAGSVNRAKMEGGEWGKRSTGGEQTLRQHTERRKMMKMKKEEEVSDSLLRR
ncbi:hypothetical protein CRG98_036357, partial [Punica granatum]